MPCLNSLIPCLPVHTADPDPAYAGGKLDIGGADALLALHRPGDAKLRLGKAAVDALWHWTYWTAYASQCAQEPDLARLPGWKIVLPADVSARTESPDRDARPGPDRERAADKLYRVLLRAGEPPDIAREAAELFYAPATQLTHAFSHSQYYEQMILHGGLSRAPRHGTAFQALPRWAREMALFAADLHGKDLSGTPGLAGLDLRFLSAYCTNFGDCDLSDTDLSHADLRGADFRRAITDDTRFDDALVAYGQPLHSRAWPPLSPNDTAIQRDGYAVSVHAAAPSKRGKAETALARGKFLEDDEVLQMLPIVDVRRIGDLDIAYTLRDKAVIQQQAMRGCTAATAAMLVADHGHALDTRTLMLRNLGTSSDIMWDLRKAGLEAIRTQVTSMQDLENCIARRGAAEVGIWDERLGLHSVIVDHVDLARGIVHLRDPFLGWAVVVSSQWLTERIGFPRWIVQAALPPTPSPPARAMTDPRLKA